MSENSEPGNQFENDCCVTRGLKANVRAREWESVKGGHPTGAHRESGL